MRCLYSTAAFAAASYCYFDGPCLKNTKCPGTKSRFDHYERGVEYVVVDLVGCCLRLDAVYHYCRVDKCYLIGLVVP